MLKNIPVSFCKRISRHSCNIILPRHTAEGHLLTEWRQLNPNLQQVQFHWSEANPYLLCRPLRFPSAKSHIRILLSDAGSKQAAKKHLLRCHLLLTFEDTRSSIPSLTYGILREKDRYVPILCRILPILCHAPFFIHSSRHLNFSLQTV